MFKQRSMRKPLRFVCIDVFVIRCLESKKKPKVVVMMIRKIISSTQVTYKIML